MQQKNPFNGFLRIVYLAANTDKCHLLTSSKTTKDIHTSDATVSNEKKSKTAGNKLRSYI